MSKISIFIVRKGEKMSYLHNIWLFPIPDPCTSSSNEPKPITPQEQITITEMNIELGIVKGTMGDKTFEIKQSQSNNITESTIKTYDTANQQTPSQTQTNTYSSEGTLQSSTLSHYDSNGNLIDKDIMFHIENGAYNANLITNGQNTIDNLLNIENQITHLYQNNQGVSVQEYNHITDYISNYLVNEAPTYQTPYTNTYFDISPQIITDPIGAFYESTTNTQDNSTSIADKTFRILGANNEGVSKEYLASLDANGDGKLSDSELSSLKTYKDLNENGIAESGEITALNTQGINKEEMLYAA